MVLTRWDPIYEIRRAHGLANRCWAGFPSYFSEANASANTSIDASDTPGRQDWSIPLDIVREGDNITVKASLPGVNPEDIDVTVEGGVLTIKAATEVEESVRMLGTWSGNAGRVLSTGRCGCPTMWTPTRLSPVTRTTS